MPNQGERNILQARSNMTWDLTITKLAIPYALSGGLILKASLSYCMMTAFLPGGKLKATSNQMDHGKTLNKKQMAIFALVLLLFMFACVLEINYTTFLSTFAVTYLQWTDQLAATLTTVFMLTFTIGRFVGIFTIRLLGPVKLIGFSITFSILSMIPLYLLDYSETLVWIASGVLGFAISTQYATILIWTDTILHLSSNMASLLIFSGSTGYTVGPFFQGILFDVSGIFSFVHLCSISLGFVLVLYLVISGLISRSWAIGQDLNNNNKESEPLLKS